MEKLKYSILVSAYANYDQFHNFLWTACNQNFDNYEIVVVDNKSPSNRIYEICEQYKSDKNNIIYYRIEDKKCTNITHGINIAAGLAKGEIFIIVADSNVLLSFNLLNEIDKNDLKYKKILISGRGTDVKISPDGVYKTEYQNDNPENICEVNNEILRSMGWPCDPMKLKLIEGRFRIPPPHHGFDIYIAAMLNAMFFEGPYNEHLINWGEYHSDFVKQKCTRYGFVRLRNIKIVHQFHRVWKNQEAY